MTAPMRTRTIDDELDELLARPGSSSSIDDDLDGLLGAASRSQPRGTFASESTVARGPATAPQRNDLSAAKGFTRQVASGATFGTAPRIEAAVRTGFGATGDYAGTRDAIYAANDAFQSEHLIASIVGQVAGGVATGGALGAAAKGGGALARAVRASQLAPKIEATAGAGARAAQAAKTGAVVGGLTGAGSTRHVEDLPQNLMVGIGAGAAGGALFSGVTDIARRTRQALASANQSDRAGPVRRFAQAGGGTPEVAATQKVAQAMGRGGTTLDDLERLSAQAEGPTALAELIGDDQGIRSLRVARNLGRNRERIDRSLAERAAAEPSRFAEVVARESAVPEGLDANVVAARAIEAVEPRVSELYAKAYQRPDVASTPALKSMTKLAQMKRGRAALERAGELSSGFDALQLVDAQNPVISVQNLHYLRQGVDFSLDRAVEEGDAQMVRILSTERAKLDRAFKQAAGKLGRRADQLWEQASAEGESFAAGQRSQMAKTNQGIHAAKASARDAEAFRRGAASKQLEAIESTPDGATGTMRNPTRATMEHGIARARARLGYSNPQSFERVAQASENINARLRTKNAVSGGSTTAANLGEMADFAAPEEAIKKLMSGNVTGAIGSATDSFWRGLTRGDNAAQADAMGSILGAGLPGQMSRAEALEQMKVLLPMLQNFYNRNAITQGNLAGGVAGRAAQR